MPAAPASISPHKSTNVRFKFKLAAARIGHRVAAELFPGRAERRLRAIMLTPLRPADLGMSDLVRDDNARRIPHGGRWLPVWSFGEGPTVLLVHGWGGHAAQFDSWIESIVAAGYRAVLFDAPAHGRSGGRMTNIMEMAGAIQHVAALHGPVHTIVAHSFGAPASLFALRHGLEAPRLVLISAPISLTGFSHFLAQRFGFPLRVRGRMQRNLEREFGFRWDESDTDRALAELVEARGLDVLLVHDRKDREVPFASSERIAARVPAARLLATEGSGHTRILRNGRVIAEALDFAGGGGIEARRAA